MEKELSEMTLEELWQLFPIFLAPHKSVWREWFIEEKKRLQLFLPGENIMGIYHIGSTAVDGIWAKPIIDLLVEISPETELAVLKRCFLDNGYICMAESSTRISFNRGYTKHGFAEKAYHLHLRCAGDKDEIYFREYLCAHREVAEAYEQLKLGLWKQYEHDRDAYTEAKTEFVLEYTKKAKMLYTGK
jgi:GrpB-like predicted nucleotidyltransferase (UPF0157 family)